MIKRNLIGRTAMLVAASALILSGCKKKADTDSTVESSPKQTSSQEVTTTEKDTSQKETATDDEKAPDTDPVDNGFPSLESDTSLIPKGETVRSFLTGEWINDTIAYRRPIAVMYNNIQAGLPQSGISMADVIFEGQCEGGVTRLMGVFQNYDDVTSIGSIRSCRDYYPFLAAEYDAAYFHFGQSDFALEFLSDPELRTFNGMNGDYNYERRSDRVSPHNVFTTPENLVTAMVNKKVSTYLDEDYVAPLKFNKSKTPIDYPDAEKCITLKTGYAYNNAYFVYNEDDGLYYRYEYGEPQIDEMTGEQIAVENIIFKLVPGEQYWNGSPLYLLTGSGIGLYVTNGTAQWIKWSKEVDGVNTNLGCNYTYGYGPTRYTYWDDSEITFNQGKTWVCIYEQENQANIEILDK